VTCSRTASPRSARCSPARSSRPLLDGPLALVYLVVVFIRDPLFGKCLAALTSTQNRLVEVIGGIETLKASGAEPRVMQRWSDLFATQLDTQLDADVRGGLVKGLLDAALGAIRFLAPPALAAPPVRRGHPGAVVVHRIDQGEHRAERS
jgi:hypothetical protein